MSSYTVFLGVLLLWAGSGAGQAAHAAEAPSGTALPALSFQTFHPASDVKALAQTTDGYVWLGTQRGLFRFDGTRFVLFASEQTPPMPGGAVTALFATRSRSLWVGTERGVAVFEAGKFLQPPGAPVAGVRRFALDQSGWLWIATSSGLLQTRAGVWVHHGVAEGLPSLDVTDVVVDPEGGLWAQTSEGRVKRQGNRFAPVTPSLQASDVALPLPLYASRAVRDNTAAWHGFAGTAVTAALVDSQNAVWVGRPFAGGLLRWQDGHRRVFTMRDGLAANVVLSLLEDAEGGMWAGTAGGGVTRMQASRWYEFTRADGLPGDAVFGLSASKQGSVWAVTSGGVVRVAPKRLQVWPLGKALPQASPRWVAEDAAGSVWLVDAQGHTAILRAPFTENAAFTSLPELDAGAASSALFTDEAGRVWRALRDGRIDELTNAGAVAVRPADVTCVQQDGACGRAVRSFAQNSAGGLWLGTFADGVWRMNAQAQSEPVVPGAIVHGEAVQSLVEDDAGVLWLATKIGLVRFDGKRTQRFTAADGLPATPVLALVQDGVGRVWGAGPAGIFCVHEDAAIVAPIGSATRFINFGVEDGLRNEVFTASGAGAVRSRDGRLWFASAGGLVAMEDPEDVSAPPTPRVVIESVQGTGMPARIVLAEDERIPVPRNDVRIHFAAPAFSEAQRVHYRYRVGRTPGAWVDVGPQRFAHLVALPPGNVQFEVQATRLDRPEHTESARIRLIVSRRYYERPIFIVCAMGILGAFAWALREKARRRAQLGSKDVS